VLAAGDEDREPDCLPEADDRSPPPRAGHVDDGDPLPGLQELFRDDGAV